MKKAMALVALVGLVMLMSAIHFLYAQSITIENDLGSPSSRFSLTAVGANKWGLGLFLLAANIPPGETHTSYYYIDGTGHFTLTDLNSGCVYDFGYYAKPINSHHEISLKELFTDQPCMTDREIN